MKKFSKIIPDTSILIEGTLSKRLLENQISVGEIVIHQASIAEMEAQANKNREIGYFGLDEVKQLRELAKTKKFTISYKGARPAEFEINFAKAGEIDAIIRKLAGEEKGTLFTADRVQALVAESQGIPVQLIQFVKKIRKNKIEKYFDTKTMSIHLKDNTVPAAKKGKPGKWKFVKLTKTKLKQKQIQEIAKSIINDANTRKDSFIEISRKGSTVVQMGRYRIVITKPPFASSWEITAVRPVKTLSLKHYKLSDKLKERVAVKAEGILVAGAPGMGKSTFAQALAEYYVKQNKIIKTVEAPRDLIVPPEVTQYSLTQGSHDEIHDILLLSRPDYTFFDEIRNFPDFRVFADLRLAGVGMVGVVHATNPIDAIQRFLGKIELGIIPQVVDTVVFIKNGEVNKVLSMKMEVKVPNGMQEADLARPVVMVNDFETGIPAYEIYTYGEQTVVMPVKDTKTTKSMIWKYAAEEIADRLSQEIGQVEVEVTSDNRFTAYVPEKSIGKIIGQQGQNINRLEQWIGMKIDVQPLKQPVKATKRLDYDVQMAKKTITFTLPKKAINKHVSIYIDGEYLVAGQVSKTAKLKIRKKADIGKELILAINAGKDIRLYY